MITVAFCQAFLWMIVMTFYHTGMPTVAQAWYFDTFLRSLEIFCCRYHDEFAGVDMCRAVRWRWKCRQIHQVRPGGHRSARHPIWRPGGSTQRLRSWTGCWFTVATSAFLSSTFGRPKSQKHAIKAGDLGASEHFASRFFCLLAVVCTSFSAMNIATSKRSPCTPFGDTTLPHVRATCSHFF